MLSTFLFKVVTAHSVKNHFPINPMNKEKLILQKSPEHLPP